MRCWASCLGDCSNGISAEHYVSDGIFDAESVTLVGFPWCRDEPKTIGLSSAVANILCSTHNSALSDFDNEAAKLSKFLVDTYRLPQINHSIALNGYLLEKWALKTFLNLGYLQALHREQPNRLEPPESLVRYIYRNASVSSGIGLYHVSGSIGPSDLEAGLSWNAIRTVQQPDQVAGITMVFYGVRLVVTIDPIRSEEKIHMMGLINEFDYSESQVTYRPSNITFLSSSAGRKSIELRW